MTTRERIRELADGKLTAAEIAERLGASTGYVWEMVILDGLKVAPTVRKAPPPSDTWPLHRVAKLKRLWAKGVSITKIGNEIGVSRNAVISKVRRLDLPKRGQLETFTAPAKPAPLRRIVESTKLPERLMHADSIGAGIGMSDANRSDCAWPLWSHKDRPSFRVCGKPIRGGCSYCEIHAAVAFKARPEERAAA